MADGTKIEWTDATWTPIRARSKATGKVGWHCEHASPGCMNCYSESFNEKRLGTGLPFKPGHRADVEHFLDEAMLIQPLRWRRPRMVFVCSMTDLFGDWVSNEWIDRVFAVMALCPGHTFQILTKRPERMRAYLSRGRAHPVGLAALEQTMRHLSRYPNSNVGDGVKLLGDIAHLQNWPLPNVWLGVSAEDQRRADERVPILLQTPAAVRWVSAEPLLGPIEFWQSCQIAQGTKEGAWEATQNLDLLHWIVAGGESGAGARPMHPDWVRSIRDQCAAARVPFLFKQWGAWAPMEEPSSETQEDEELRGVGLWMDGQYLRNIGKKHAGRLLDGVVHDGFPQVEEVPFCP